MMKKYKYTGADYFRYDAENGYITVDCYKQPKGRNTNVEQTVPFVYISNENDAQKICDVLNATMRLMDGCL